jgi:predicted lipoprotein with Yx(FWY)xxD motif
MFSGERDVDETRKMTVAHTRPSANLLNQGRRIRRASVTSKNEAACEQSARPAGHLLAGTPRLMRLGWSVSGVAALALLVAACTGGGYASTYGAGQATSSGPPPAAVVDLRVSTLGQTLVDGQGRTLYLFEADKAGKSECTGGCTAAWPPYLGGATPRAGTGVTAALLSTISRGDGGTQVTYAGHPLYRYAGDNQPGDITGQGLDQYGAEWYVLGPNGSKIGGQ